jgi:hypothetical protein
MAQSIKIASWNVNGLCKKLNACNVQSNEVVQILCKYDFIGLVETWTTVRSNVKLPGYSYVCKHRHKRKKKGRPSGGLIFYYKSKYKGCVHVLDANGNDHEDIMWVKIDGKEIGQGKDIYICLVYAKPTGETDIFNQIEAGITAYSSIGEILLLGDFNSRTGSLVDHIVNDNAKNLPLPDDYAEDEYIPRGNCDDKVNAFGQILVDICISSQLRILNGRHIGDSLGFYISFKTNGCSVVDYMIASNAIREKVAMFRVKVNLHLSDHALLEVSIKSNTVLAGASPNEFDIGLQPLYGRYSWGPGSRDNFNRAMLCPKIVNLHSSYLTNNYECTTPGSAQILNDFTNIIVSAANDSLHLKLPPKLRKQDQPKKLKTHIWFNRNCYLVRSEMRRLKKQCERDPFNTAVRSIYLAKCNQYKKLLKQSQSKYKNWLLQNLLTLEQSNPKSFWKTLDKLKEMSTADSHGEANSITGEEWYNHFKRLSNKGQQNSVNTELLLELENRQKDIFNVNFMQLDGAITIKEIKTVIKGLKNNKATSHDMIANEMLKSSCDIVLPGIAKLFNHVLKSGIYPMKWNMGYQVPVFKNGDPQDCNNYRGITISSCLGKVFNSVLNNRLMGYLEANNKLSDNQAAYRKGFSTTDHICTLRSVINKYVIHNKTTLYCCFVDFSKAFDSVPRDLLFLKLLRMGIGGKFYSIIKHMYMTADSCVKLPNGITKVFKTDIGIKQGDSLSPMLFNLFLDDIVDDLKQCDADPVKVQTLDLGCLLYADDMLLMSKSALGLQKAINCLGHFGDKWGMTVNCKKTKVLIFQKRGVTPKKLNFMLQNRKIEIVQEYTYLGILFTKSGSLKPASILLAKKAKKAMFRLRNVLHSQSILDPNIHLKLFDSMIRPIATYGCPIWSQDLVKSSDIFKNVDKNAVEQVQIKMCKGILRVPRNASGIAVCGELGRHPLLIFILIQTIQFWFHITASKNQILKNAFQSEIEIDKNGTHTLASVVRILLTKFGMEKLLKQCLVETKKCIVTELSMKLRNKYETYFKEIINSSQGTSMKGGNKLRSYAKMKGAYRIEPYLNSRLPKKYLQHIAAFRLSTHKLEIELGRYHKPKPIPVDERICRQCALGKTEDEVHFMFECDKYTSQRHCFLREIKEAGLTVSTLNGLEGLREIFTNEGRDVLYSLGKFLTNCISVRI